MAGEILVALKPHDQIGEIMPYMDEIARPGMKVVFLIPYPVDGLGPFLTQLETMEGGIRTTLAAGRMAMKLSWAYQKQLAEARVAFACEALAEKGVETAVDLYAEPLKKVMERYACNGNVHLVVMPERGNLLIEKFWNGFTALFGSAKRTPCPRVLLLHPSA